MFEAQVEQAGIELLTVHGTHFFVQEDSERAAALVRKHLPA
jgi:surfactin synthase thioesterase subunit